MKVGRRVRVYLIGLALGIIATYFIYGNRSCDWLPGKRVMTLIEETPILISDQKSCEMECYGLTKKDIFNILQTGEVHFTESEIEDKVKNYVVSNESHKITFQVDMVDSVVHITKFHGFDQACACEGKSEISNIVMYKPNDLVLEQLVENEFEVTRTSECLFECYDLDSTYVRSVLDDGTVLNDMSFPFARPNPTFWIQKIKNQADTLLFKMEKGSKTRVIDIRWKNMNIPCDCN